jgi:hypothetical protein
MNKFKHITTLLIFLISFSGNNFAQIIDYDLEFTEKYINEKLSPSCKIFANKKSISVKYYSKGKLVRVDEFYAEAIDREKGIYHSEEEKAIILACYENSDQCITREILVLDEKKFYSRLTLMTECTENDCLYLKRALTHLLMLYIADEDYLRVKPFEVE